MSQHDANGRAADLRAGHQEGASVDTTAVPRARNGAGPSAGGGEQVPGLDVRGPVIVGALAITAFFGVGIAWAAIQVTDRITPVDGRLIESANTVAVQALGGGVVQRVLVKADERVREGQLLAQIGAAGSSRRLAQLQAQLEATKRALIEIADASVSVRLPGALGASARIDQKELERQRATAEVRARRLTRQLARARRAQGATEIRAPFAGRVKRIMLPRVGQAIEPGAVVFSLARPSQLVLVAGRTRTAGGARLKVGMPVAVRFTGPDADQQSRLWPGRVAKVVLRSPDAARSAQAVTVELDARRGELEEVEALFADRYARMLVTTGKQTLLAQIIAPLRSPSWHKPVASWLQPLMRGWGVEPTS
ncbi:MAG: HlyD family efflux transporter periplasmic adaptor subunit [Pseudomonadota bacterium]